jgi:hypothetical protein
MSGLLSYVVQVAGSPGARDAYARAELSDQVRSLRPELTQLETLLADV